MLPLGGAKQLRFRVTTGSPAVTVGVADTGLDFTHSELGPRITQVVDFTANKVVTHVLGTQSSSGGRLSPTIRAARSSSPMNTNWL